jgi:hypothetical protein
VSDPAVYGHYREADRNGDDGEAGDGGGELFRVVGGGALAAMSPDDRLGGAFLAVAGR